MTDHPATARRKLGELSTMASRTDDAERRILESAEAQLDKMQARIAELRPSVLLNKGDADEYQRLISDRRRLQVVVAQARKNVGE